MSIIPDAIQCFGGLAAFVSSHLPARRPSIRRISLWLLTFGSCFAVMHKPLYDPIHSEALYEEVIHLPLRDQLHGRRGGACCRPDFSIGGCFGQVAVEGHGADGYPAARVVVPDALAGQQPAGRVQ